MRKPIKCSDLNLSPQEIMSLISGVTDIPVAYFTEKKRTPTRVAAKDLACVIMLEEGIHYEEIMQHLNLNRCMFYHISNRLEKRFSVDSEFKKNYLACIARISEMEEQHAKV